MSCNYFATIDFYNIYKLLNKLKLLIIYCQSIIGATLIRGASLFSVELITVIKHQALANKDGN
ncbi:hypothetical protein D7V64_08215 [Acinetobacter cumulans]|uniref:Uncharacterized protein n=1 Tax=Acinetobacter cumulans TaxID=2136182 RepID=A0A3A8G2Q6_9GAMM|nr:hypothetical protein D7V64_08215 [Acinetobacter cumulans]